MITKKISGGVAHNLPADLKKALLANPKSLAAWENITSLARNEWICWTVSVKQDTTRNEHVRRVCSDLAGGKRRPCCWVGCIHRTDKAVSPWARKVLLNQQSKSK